MIEVYKNLWVGSDADWDFINLSNETFSIIHAAKEPYHRELLGYTEKGAPRGHPYYLFARLDNILYLNLVDAEEERYIPKAVIDEALSFISDRLAIGNRILVHCNEGKSRAPGIAFLWMYENKHLPQSFKEAGPVFKQIYPYFFPKNGIFQFIRNRIYGSETGK